MTDRRTAREHALQALYAQEYNPESFTHILEHVIKRLYALDHVEKIVEDSDKNPGMWEEEELEQMASSYLMGITKNKQYKFSEQLFLKTMKHEEELDDIIKEHIENWEIGRLAMLDRLILRMALAELLYFEEIPTKVSMNEAIEIAKDFSTRKSGSFVNGILDAALEQLKKEGRIQKSGRGLIEQ
ncbi:MAG: transcription antitermination factor NusB [Bacteroidota bacterium]